MRKFLALVLVVIIFTLFAKNIHATQFSFNYSRALNVPAGMHDAGDIDNDGDLDIAVIGGLNFSIFENNGSQDISQWPLWGNPPHGLDSTQQAGLNGAKLFDVDADGDLDFVAAKYQKEVGWWENPGGSLSATLWSFHILDNNTGGRYLHDLILVDINKDGIAEEFLATLNNPGYWNTASTLKWYRPPNDLDQNKDQIWPSVTVFSDKPGANNNHAGIDVGDIDGDGDLDIGFSNGWVESSSLDGTGPWTWHELTNIYGVSNNLIRDLDLDGDNDLIMSAGHHGQGVYWFENDGTPASGSWTFHKISDTINDIYSRHRYNDPNEDQSHIHHPECLQANDLDNDGDLDVITCTLFFGEDPGEPDWSDEVHDLWIFENTGGNPPNFNTQKVEDNNYTNYKLQFHDINADGKPDIIANGARISNVNLLINTTDTTPPLSPTPTPTPTSTDVGQWWNDNWDYRIPVQVNMNGYERIDKPVDVSINFTQLFDSLGHSGVALNQNSIRIIEVDGQGTVLNESVTFQFDKDLSFNESSNAQGNLVFLLNGSTPSTSTRYFQIYFDVVGKSFTPPTFTSQVNLTDAVEHEGEESYKIDTQNATYYYHKAGAGFASIQDTNGVDWIDYHKGGGSTGEYRGIPNVPGFGHPGGGTSYGGQYRGTSSIENLGPIKITYRSVRHDDAAEHIWEVYPTYIKNTVVKMPSTFTWGYEGVPGGAIEAAIDYRIYSDATNITLNNSSSNDLPNPEWLYFADPSTNQKIYLVNHQDDDIVDAYWTMNNEMTVFGFGRVATGNYQLNTFPGYFTLGFANATSFEQTEKQINSAYRDLGISLGSAESRQDSTPYPGDANGDDLVNIADYAIWINQYLNYNPAPNANPDFNDDNQIDGIDYWIWLTNYSP